MRHEKQLNNLPSAEQFKIASGKQQVIVTEVGATLRSYTFDNCELIDGFCETDMATGSRGQPLIPWPNRLKDGTYRFDGTVHQLPIDEPERNNAIHGLLRWENWLVNNKRDDLVEMRYTLHPRPGYPFTLTVFIAYELNDKGLTVTTTALNNGTATLPLGIGFHPYLKVGTEYINDATLMIPADTVLNLDQRGIPVGKQNVTGTKWDFRNAKNISDTRLDTAFYNLKRNCHGVAETVLANPYDNRRITLWMDNEFGYLMCYTGDTLSETARRRKAIALEPMTCPPNGFCSGEDLILLKPSEQFKASWGIMPFDF
ncbi:MAG: aldose 1-epimerase family protein [Actinobacteria bacterium]|nr:aldose 1-epimerase family protein [Actinomycetota bacterium]